MRIVILSLLAVIGMSAHAQMHQMPMPARQPFKQVDPARPHTIVYHLYITDSTVNYTGRHRHTIAVNGSLPGPTLEFTEGDTAEVHIHNEMMMATSVHWHGILIPNRYDGVPYLTSAPIRPMSTYTVVFPIRQNGTYWYHSHTMLQEQIGLYGAIVIHKREQPPPTQKELVVLLSDWTDETPYEVDRSLHYATDWYAIRKGSTQDYAAAIKQHRLHTKLVNEWKRMLAMDVSDVYYDKFTVNGKPEDTALAVPTTAPVVSTPAPVASTTAPVVSTTADRKSVV